MDHLLRWIETRPDEWHEVTGAAARTPFLVIGRTPQAYATYPRAMRETERPINRLFSRIFGQELDLCAATRGMSRDVACMLLEESTSAATFGVDTEWPAIAFRRGIGLVYLEGMRTESQQHQAPRPTRPGSHNWRRGMTATLRIGRSGSGRPRA